KRATIVWDKFHILQRFGEAVNDVRKALHGRFESKDPLMKLTRGKYRFTFLKRSTKRDKVEQQHINDVVAANEDFASLELIKERMLSFFDSQTETDAKEAFEEIGNWISQKQVADLMAGRDDAFKALGNWW